MLGKRVDGGVGGLKDHGCLQFSLREGIISIECTGWVLVLVMG